MYNEKKVKDESEGKKVPELPPRTEWQRTVSRAVRCCIQQAGLAKEYGHDEIYVVIMTDRRPAELSLIFVPELLQEEDDRGRQLCWKVQEYLHERGLSTDRPVAPNAQLPDPQPMFHLFEGEWVEGFPLICISWQIVEPPPLND